MKTRDEAFSLLKQYTQSESLIKHALCVEAAMREAAIKNNEDVEKWGITGLIHDFDYEKYPEAPDHPLKGSEILKQEGYPDDIITAILGHATYTKTPRNTLMAKWLFALDELCGFIVAVALVRPDFLDSLEVKSVKKKLKDKAFARSVSREDIYKGAEELSINLDDLISFTIEALRKNKDKIGF
ncbi:MAG TPA: HD domain-containing protein [Ignavibacteria bacterium]|jgi:predicted hydrolase (HD superfamily)